MKAIGYIRVSTDKQDLDKQRHLLLEYAQQKQGGIPRVSMMLCSSFCVAIIGCAMLRNCHKVTCGYHGYLSITPLMASPYGYIGYEDRPSPREQSRAKE